MNYKNILFDLDGTLTDPKVGITKSVAYALAAYGIEVTDLDTLCHFIGPPLYDSFRDSYGFSDADCLKLIDTYREYFSVTGKFENEVYPNIPELLKHLTDTGHRLFIATSKPERFAKEILEHFGLAGYFERIRGIAMDEEHITKDEVIARVMREYALEKEDTLMVGDRHFDINGAIANGIDSLGVSYGYGTRDELTDAGAKYIADTTNELYDFFRS